MSEPPIEYKFIRQQSQQSLQSDGIEFFNFKQQIDIKGQQAQGYDQKSISSEMQQKELNQQQEVDEKLQEDLSQDKLKVIIIDQGSDKDLKKDQLSEKASLSQYLRRQNQQQKNHQNQNEDFLDQKEQLNTQQNIEFPCDNDKEIKHQIEQKLENIEEQTENQNNLVPEKDSTRKKKIVISIVSVILAVGIIIVSLYLNLDCFLKPCPIKPQNLCEDLNICPNLKPNITFVGQEQNLVKRAFEQNYTYHYIYKINNKQKVYVNPQDFQEKITKIEYLIDFTCVNVTDEMFTVLMIFRETIQYDENQKKTVTIEYDENTNTANKIEETPQDNNNTESPFSDSNTTYNDSKYKNEQEILERIYLQPQDVMESSIPIIKFDIMKNGSVQNIVFSLNLKSQLFQLSPRLINIFSPALSKSVYHTNNFRILQENTQTASSSDESIKEHNPQGAEIVPTFGSSNSSDGSAILQKSFTADSSTNDSNPNSINQKTQYQEESKIGSDGILKESKVKSSVDQMNSEQTDSDDSNDPKVDQQPNYNESFAYNNTDSQVNDFNDLNEHFNNKTLEQVDESQYNTNTTGDEIDPNSNYTDNSSTSDFENMTYGENFKDASDTEYPQIDANDTTNYFDTTFNNITNVSDIGENDNGSDFSDFDAYNETQEEPSSNPSPTPNTTKENATKSSNLIHGMKMETESIMEFLNQTKSQTSDKILKEFYRQSNGQILTLNKFQKFVDIYNVQRQNTQDNDTNVTRTGRFLHVSGNIHQQQYSQDFNNRRVLAPGQLLIAETRIKLFQYNIISVKVANYLVFSCVEGPANSNKDICRVRMDIEFLGIKISAPIPEIEIQAPIKKIVNKVNYYKKQIVDKLLQMKIDLKKGIFDLDNDLTSVLQTINALLDENNSPFLLPLIYINGNISLIIEQSVLNLQVTLNQFIGVIKTAAVSPIQLIKQQLEKSVSKIIQQFSAQVLKKELEFTQSLDQIQQKIQQMQENLKCIDLFQIQQTQKRLQDIQNSFTDKMISSFDNFNEQIISNQIEPIITKIQQILQQMLAQDNNDQTYDNVYIQSFVQLKNIVLNRMINQILLEFQKKSSNILQFGQKLIKDKIESMNQKIQQKYDSIFSALTSSISNKFTQQQCPLLNSNASYSQQEMLFNQLRINQISVLEEQIENILETYLSNYQQDGEYNGGSDSNLFSQIDFQLDDRIVNYLIKQITLNIKFLGDQQIKLLNDQCSNFTKTFIAGFEGIKNSFNGAGDNIQESLNKASLSIKQLVKNFLDNSQKLINDFKSLIKHGNAEGKELSKPSPLELNSFMADINQLKNLFNLGSNGIANSINQVLTLDKKISKFIEAGIALIQKPIQTFKNLSFNIDKFSSGGKRILGFSNPVPVVVQENIFDDIVFIDGDDIRQIFDAMVKKVKDETVDYIKQQVESTIKKQALEAILKNSAASKILLQGTLTKNFFDQLKNLDAIFQTIIKKIMDSFSYRWYKKWTLLNKLWQYKFNFMTPIGIPIVLGIGLDVKASLDVTFAIRASQVCLIAGAQASSSIQASAGVNLYILEIGAYIRGTIFYGRIQIGVTAYLQNKFKANLKVTFETRAFSFRAGIYIRYLKIRFTTRCWYLWRLMERRQLQVQNQNKSFSIDKLEQIMGKEQFENFYQMVNTIDYFKKTENLGDFKIVYSTEFTYKEDLRLRQLWGWFRSFFRPRICIPWIEFSWSNYKDLIPPYITNGRYKVYTILDVWMG